MLLFPWCSVNLSQVCRTSEQTVMLGVDFKLMSLCILDANPLSDVEW